MNEEDIQQIIDKKSLNYALDPSEEKIFEEWIAIPGNRDRYREQYGLIRLLMVANVQHAKPDMDKYRRKQKKIYRKKIYMYAMSCAAGILLFGFIISLLFPRFYGEKASDTTAMANNGTERAVVLMFASGEKMSLENGYTGVLKENNSFKVTKDARNELSYLTKQTDLQNVGDRIEYNTLSIPSGKDYHLFLADGSEVWLNSDSELTFPVAFGSGPRNIYLKGEGYFQVVSDTSRPFIVNTDGFKVRVTGTHFNICEYPGRNEITLTEGVVEVIRGEETKKLNPGQQAVLLPEGFMTREVDTDSYIAWVDGCLRYRNTNLRRIMEDVARWYDLDVYYMDQKTQDLHFSVAFRRDIPIDNVLTLLEKTEKIVFVRKEKALFIYKAK